MTSVAKRRVLVVVDEMEVGGSQRQIVHLLAGLDRSQWTPELLYFRRPSFLVSLLERSAVKVRHLPKNGRLDLMFLTRFIRLLRQERYDLVHAFSLTAEVWTLVASKALRNPPPVVSSLRCLNLTAARWEWRLKRAVLKGSAATIANSHAAAKVAEAMIHFPADRIDVIGNGVAVPEPMDKEERRLRRISLGVPNNRVLGLFVGRLTELKNLGCLIDAMVLVPPAKRPWIALVGDGPLRECLQQRIDRAGLSDDVVLTGERADAISLMQTAEFLVLCSSEEGLSNALLEAMAAGCPVVASNVGGNPELVEHQRTGLLFEADDRGQLADALALFSSDPELRMRLSSHARAKASGFGIGEMVTATLAVYQRCCEAPPQPAFWQEVRP